MAPKENPLISREYNLGDHSEIFIVSNAVQDGKPLGLRRAGMGFPSDGEDKVVPNPNSFLYAWQVSPEGGDIIFADMYTAYEALPAEVRHKITGHRVPFSC